MSTKAKNPFVSVYHPELDDSPELDANDTMFYQEIVGMLRWAVELDHSDINLKVSLMSSHTTHPRIGRMNALIQIFSFFKTQKQINHCFRSTPSLYQ